MGCLQVVAGDRVAILIGLSSYAHLPDTLHAASDVRVVRDALQNHGFEQIHTLLDTQATKANILALLQDSPLAPGQVMVILLAGHGVQVGDDADEEPDHLDEAFVPYDGMLQARSSLLTDDELQACLTQIRHQLGETGELLLLIDACYGGGMNRNLQPVYTRGFAATRKPFGPRDTTGWHDQSLSTTPGMAPLIVICASQPHELSFEVQDESGNMVGPLSWSFCHALYEVGQSANYATLFQRMQAWMHLHARQQSPLIVGSADRRLFGGRHRPPPQHFRVIDTLQGIVNGGAVLGWQAGDTLGLFPPGTSEAGMRSPIAIGVLTLAGSFQSTLQWLGRPPSSRQQANNWILPLRPQAPRFCLPFLADCQGDPYCLGFCRRLIARQLASTDSLAPALRIHARSGRWQLRNARGQVFWEGGPGDSLAANAAIRRLSIAYALARLHTLDPACASALELVHSDSECGAIASSAPSLDFAVGDTFGMRFTNLGTIPLWMHVIALDSGGATLLLPATDAGLPGPKLLPGASLYWPSQCWVLTCPDTSDCTTHLKLIASSQPLDLRGLFDPTGQMRGGKQLRPTWPWTSPPQARGGPSALPRLWTQDLIWSPQPFSNPSQRQK